MDLSKLTPSERAFRMNVRNFLLTANRKELEDELRLSNLRGDDLRAKFVQELIDESEPDN